MLRRAAALLILTACTATEEPFVDPGPIDLAGLPALGASEAGTVAKAKELQGPFAADTNGDVYFGGLDETSGTPALFRVGRDGGTVRRLVAGVNPTLTSWALHGDAFVFTAGAAIESVPKAGGTKSALVPGASLTAGLQSDSGTLYFNAMLDTQPGLWRLPAGGAPAIVQPSTLPFVADGDSIFLSTGAASTVIRKIPAIGGESIEVAQDSTLAALSIVGAGAHLYYRGSQGTTPGGISRLPKAGGDADVILPFADGAPEHFATNDTWVWFVLPSPTVTGEFDLHRFPAAGGEGTVVASGLIMTDGLVVSGEWLYFVRYGAEYTIERVKA